MNWIDNVWRGASHGRTYALVYIVGNISFLLLSVVVADIATRTVFRWPDTLGMVATLLAGAMVAIPGMIAGGWLSVGLWRAGRIRQRWPRRGFFSLLGLHLIVWIPAAILFWVMAIGMGGAWVIQLGG